MPQGTVRAFDPATGAGTLLDDRLAEHAIDAEAFAASGLMELRVGQRVRFVLDADDDRVTQLDLVGFA